MNSPDRRISRPIYEALPYVYILCGLAALTASYVHPSKTMSLLIGLPGLLAVLGGIVVILRRRDFRQMKANNYLSDSSVLPDRKD